MWIVDISLFTVFALIHLQDFSNYIDLLQILIADTYKENDLCLNDIFFYFRILRHLSEDKPLKGKYQTSTTCTVI